MIYHYADVLADGRVRACFSYEGADIGPPQPHWESQAEGDVVLLAERVNWAGPTETSVLYMLEGALEWVETATLDDAKARAWSAIKAERDRVEAAPFEFEGGMYDPNKENISGAALAAMMAQLAGQDIADEWTLADNSRRVLTGQQIINLGLALTARVKNIHATSRALRDQLDNAQTPAEAYACAWPTEETANGNQ